MILFYAIKTSACATTFFVAKKITFILKFIEQNVYFSLRFYNATAAIISVNQSFDEISFYIIMIMIMIYHH